MFAKHTTDEFGTPNVGYVDIKCYFVLEEVPNFIVARGDELKSYTSLKIIGIMLNRLVNHIGCSAHRGERLELSMAEEISSNERDNDNNSKYKGWLQKWRRARAAART